MADFKYGDVIIYQTPTEQKILRSELEKIKEKNLEGVVVEVGVFQGGSAKIIREILPETPMYLFDTFTGFADELDDVDPQSYSIGTCEASEDFVINLMKDEKDVHIIKGKFPDTGDVLQDKQIVFAHIDVDIYNPTLKSLEFIFPKLVSGGIIMVHDYPAHNGVKKAVDEWLVGNDVETIVHEPRQIIIYKK